MTLPQIGETWTNRLNQVDGIVAKVAGTYVTFVSLTGTRVSIQFDRAAPDLGKGSPWSFRTHCAPAGGVKPDWVLKSPAPAWFQSCSRERCSGAAFIRYTRPATETVELVCPAHVPRGIRSEVPARPFLVTGFFHGSACRACLQDGIEVFGELAWSRQRRDSLWCCSVCSEWWLLIGWDGFSEDFTPLRAASRCPAGFIFQSIAGKEDTPMLPGLTYRVRVRIQVGHVLAGVRPPTIFDLVKERDS